MHRQHRQPHQTEQPYCPACPGALPVSYGSEWLPSPPDKNERVTFIPEGSALLDCSETLKHLRWALERPVKDAWTALPIFPAWIQVLGHLSLTHGVCPTLTTPSPGALPASSWLWPCLCLSPASLSVPVGLVFLSDLPCTVLVPSYWIFLGRIVWSFDKCMLRCAWQHASNDYRDLSPFFSASSWGDKTFKQPRKC